MNQPSTGQLPPGPWKLCGADRGVCKCGQIWSNDDTHIATAHHISQAAANDLESLEVYPFSEETMKAVARAIAAIPDTLAEIDRLREEVAELREALGPFARGTMSSDDWIKARAILAKTQLKG